MSHTEIVDLSSDKIYVRDLVNPSIDTSFNLVDSSLNVMHKNSMDISQNLKDLSDNVSTNNTNLSNFQTQLNTVKNKVLDCNYDFYIQFSDGSTLASLDEARGYQGFTGFQGYTGFQG